MLKQNNKENKPITNLNVPQIKLKLSTNKSINSPSLETQRSPKINSLFQRIQQSIEVKTDNQPQVALISQIPYHQMKIREKIRGQNNTPTVQLSTQESKESFNIWNDDKPLEGNLIENYLHRYKSYGSLVQQSIQHDEIAENLLLLMGMKHKMKNLGNIPFFQQQEKKTNYFMPSQKFWKLNNKKKVKTYNSIVQNSTQQSYLQNKQLNSMEIQFQNLENLRKLNSPDILKMKFKKFYHK